MGTSHITLAHPGRPLAVAICALALGACGGGPSPGERAFRREFRAEEAALTPLGQDLSRALKGASTGRQLERRLGPLADRADQQSLRLQTVKPPTFVAGDFNALRGALTRATTDLHAIVAALQLHDARSARSAIQTLLAESATITSSRRELRRKLGLPGG